MYKVAILCFISLAASASAIVVQNYALAEAPPPSSPGLDLNWDYVYNYRGGSAVSVGGNWLLTAAHVAYGGSGTVSDGNTTYNQEAVEYFGLADADLALVRFDKAFPGSYPMFTGDFDPPNPEVIMVGYGTTGSVSATQWSDSGSGGGVKHWGSQMIDHIDLTFRSKPDGVISVQTHGFYMDFDLGSTTNEAGMGVGDSGGGVFYEDNGSWKLAGIMIGNPSFSTMFAASMTYSDYSTWIADTIPEPATMSLMGFGTIGLFLTRVKRRRKLGGGRSVFPIRREPMCDLFGTMEEGDADWADVVEHTNSLTKPKHALQITLFSAWIEQFRSWLDGLNKVFWNHMVLVIEHGSAKVDAIKSAFMNDAVRGLDAFLEKITCDSMVSTCKAQKNSIQSALKRYTIRGLDAFLDKIYWDKVVSAYETRKKATRSAKEESLRDSYHGES